jgi:hypothetical protein
MSLEMSATQQKRVEKIERLRKYLGSDRPEIHEWSPADEQLSFREMSDSEIKIYLAGHQ